MSPLSSTDTKGITLDNMKQITSAENYPVVLHGTYFKAWEAIKQTV